MNNHIPKSFKRIALFGHLNDILLGNSISEAIFTLLRSGITGKAHSYLLYSVIGVYVIHIRIMFYMIIKYQFTIVALYHDLYVSFE
jgi:hypothetical protein